MIGFPLLLAVACGAESGETRLCTIVFCKLIQLINFPEIDPRDNSVDAEMRYFISGEEFYAIKDKTVGPFTPDLIVRLGTRPVD